MLRMNKMNKKLSYIAEPRTLDYPYCTLIDLLAQQTEKYPDKEAFVFRFGETGRQTATFKEIFTRSRRFASRLLKMGIKKGDTMVNLLPNCVASVYTQIGAWFCGAVSVNVLIRSDDPDALERVFNQCKAKIVVFSQFDKNQSRLITGVVGSPVNREITCSSVPSLKYVIFAEKSIEYLDSFDVESMVQTPVDESLEFPRVLPEDLAMGMHTSGTTGVPKLVSYSHYTFIAIACNYCHDGKITEATFYNDRHFGWINGAIAMTFINGSTRVCFDNTKTTSPIDAQTFFRIMDEENVSVAFCLTLIFQSLLKTDPKPNVPGSLKVLHSGGVAITSFHRGVVKQYADDLIHFYGISETGGCTSFISSDDSAYVEAIAGKPSQGGEIKIVDDHGQVVERGVRGNILYRNSFVFDMYTGDEEKTRSAFTLDHWYKTCDIGYMGEDGNLFCEGRLDDVIVAGAKVYPLEVETPLKSQAGIQDVAAVGVPGEYLRDDVCACVVPSNPELTVRDVEDMCDKLFYFGEYMSVTCRPKYIIIVESLPRSNRGKGDRKALSVMAATKLNLMQTS